MKLEIAYIDDNALNLDCIKTVLDSDFQVTIYQKPEQFFKNLPEASYAAILVDIHMPSMSGFDVFEKIAESPGYNGCPVLFISSDESDLVRINSFMAGAVDFLHRNTKPLEMIARIKSKIQFFQKHRSIIEFTTMRVNLTLLKAYLGAKELPLTFIEFKILCLVLRTYPDIVTKAQLIDQVWRTDHVLDATIYTHVSNLNSKISDWDYEINGLKTKGIQLMKKDSAV